MATYYIVPSQVPLQQRTSLVTDIETGDQVPIQQILGRPANGIQLITGDSSDSISYKLNTKFETIKAEDTNRNAILEGDADTFEGATIWSGASGHSVFTKTGDTDHIINGLLISSIEITSLTLSSGTTISMLIW